MTDLAIPKLRPSRRLLVYVLGGAALTAFVVFAIAQPGGAPVQMEGSLHAPDFALLAASPAAVQIHVAAAVFAFLLGAVLLLGPKGTMPHRTLGWIWAAAMGAVAVSSLFIRDINAGAFSFIHLLSGWTIIALPAAIYFARRHKVRPHRGLMTGLYFGGMFIAGGLTFLPGRLMWEMFFG